MAHDAVAVMKRFCVAIIAVATVAIDADARVFGGPVSGTLTVYPFAAGVSNYADLRLEGSEFSIVALDTDPGAGDAFSACMPCSPGDEINLSAIFANADLGESLVSVARDVLTPAWVTGH